MVAGMVLLACSMLSAGSRLVLLTVHQRHDERMPCTKSEVVLCMHLR